MPFQQSNYHSNVTNGADSIKPFDQHCQLVEYLPKPTLPDIDPPVTRFPHQNESRLLANNNTVGVRANHHGMHGSSMGSSLYTDASDTTDLDASPPSLDMERAAHQKARIREHETYVAMTPLIQPGGGGGNTNHVSRSELAAGQQTEFESEEPIMTWGDIASTPLVLGSGSAVDGRSVSSTDWEPTRPNNASLSSVPAFDVADESNRETVARHAEKGLIARAKTYRAAGKSALSKISQKRMIDDESSVSSFRSRTPMSATPLDRASSLTPAARALLDASNHARQSKKKKSNSLQGSRGIFQTSNSRSSSGVADQVHAGSRDSLGSSLRMSYNASNNATPRSREGDRKRKSSSLSSLRRAAGGSTPRCHSQI